MENKDRPAFPVTKDMGYADTGLTKREYFAGLAMQGLISSDRVYPNVEELIKDSFKYADEMFIYLSDVRNPKTSIK